MKKREMALAMQRIADDPGMDNLQKVTAAFGEATAIFIAASEQEMALARALGDEETAVKEQIKGNVMRLAREILADSYRLVTGERSEVYDE
jgi:hypothetical protein